MKESDFVAQNATAYTHFSSPKYDHIWWHEWRCFCSSLLTGECSHSLCSICDAAFPLHNIFMPIVIFKLFHFLPYVWYEAQFSISPQRMWLNVIQSMSHLFVLTFESISPEPHFRGNICCNVRWLEFISLHQGYNATISMSIWREWASMWIMRIAKKVCDLDEWNLNKMRRKNDFQKATELSHFHIPYFAFFFHFCIVSSLHNHSNNRRNGAYLSTQICQKSYKMRNCLKTKHTKKSG